MNDKAKFAVEILKEYAKENQVPERSTSDLSKLEEWLILRLKQSENVVLDSVSNSVVCDYCKGMGRKYAGVTLGHMSCPKCGL